MFRKQQINNPSKPVLNVEKLQQLVVELNEQNQESISGGGKFPCDGPGRGGTCDISFWVSPILFASR